MRKLIVLGAGGHCSSVVDSICPGMYSEIAGIDLPENVGKTILGVKIKGCDEEIEDFFKAGYTDAFITLGTIGNTKRRRALYSIIKQIGFIIPNIIDPTAIISKSGVRMNEGIFIGKGAIVNADTYIGNCCIINTRASVDHGTKIGDFVNLSPGSCISGDVIVENDTHIGTASTIIQGIKIGANTMIGAGSVVVRDIPANVVAYGCPCKVHKEKEN